MNYLVLWIGFVVNLIDEVLMDRIFNIVDDVELEIKVVVVVDVVGVKEILYK